MKALSIRQPWVHAILYEGKDVENRSWKTNYRGWLALHASGRPRRDARFPRGIQMPALDTLDYSAICGVAYLLDVVVKSRSKWFWHPDDGSTNYGWLLGSVHALMTPISCDGALNLWDVSPKAFRRIKHELPKLNFDFVEGH
jgi:hypothetical protein